MWRPPRRCACMSRCAAVCDVRRQRAWSLASRHPVSEMDFKPGLVRMNALQCAEV